MFSIVTQVHRLNVRAAGYWAFIEHYVSLNGDENLKFDFATARAFCACPQTRTIKHRVSPQPLNLLLQRLLSSVESSSWTSRRRAWLLTPSLAAHWTVVLSVRAASLASAFKCKLQWTCMRDSTCGSRDEQLILPQWIKPTWSPPRHDLSSHAWHYVNSYWRSRQGKITKTGKVE